MKGLIVVMLLVLPAMAVVAQKKKAKAVTQATADSLYNAGNWKAAIDAYTIVLKDPAVASVASPWLNVGVSHLNVGAYDKALAAFRKASTINPNLFQAQVYRARTLSAAGRIDHCIAFLDSAMQSGFGNFKLVDRENYFANLRSDPRWADVRARLVAASKPCMRIARAREFDFWLGEWDVFLTSNLSVRAGYNKITLSSSGCVIEENWEAFSGPHVGMSMNYFDPSDSTWKQKWAGSGQDIQEFYGGVYKDGAMRFKFDSVSPTGAKVEGKLTFTNISPDKVRQHVQQTIDGGKTWTDVYDFTYIRRDTTAPDHP